MIKIIQMFKKSKIGFILLLLLFACSEKNDLQNQVSDDEISYVIKTGFNWEFEQDINPNSNSGLFYMGRLPDYPFVENYGHTLFWSDLNPDDGVFDFSEIKNILEEAKNRKLKVVFRLKGIVVDRVPASIENGEKKEPYVPQWVIDKHNPNTFFTLNTTSEKIKVIAPWDQGVQQEYKKFIEAFAKEELFKNSSFAGVYIHGFSSSFGEEFWLKRSRVQDAINAGMTENKLVQTFKDRIDWWAEAANEFKHKLIWIGYHGVHNYNKEVLDNYALSKGLGWRGGGIEFYTNSVIMPPYLGQTYNNETNYITVDWSNPLRDGKRYFGDENELLWNNESQQVNKFITETTVMKAGQLGVNYLWTSTEAIKLSPKMFEWFTKIAGKKPSESPDAVCWLREDYRDQYTIKNLERLLYQRDKEGYKTKNADKIIRPKFYQNEKKNFAYTSRTTDVINKQKGMLFFINETLKNTLTTRFKIQVNYFDDDTAEWILKYQNKDDVVKSKTIIGKGDNIWKTAEFIIEKGALNANREVSDFRIELLNGKNLKVKFVRVLK